MRRGKERKKKKDLGQQYKRGNGTSMVVRLRISASLVISNFLFKGVLDVDFQMDSLKETQGYVIYFFSEEKLQGKIKILLLIPSTIIFSSLTMVYTEKDVVLWFCPCLDSTKHINCCKPVHGLHVLVLRNWVF